MTRSTTRTAAPSKAAVKPAVRAAGIKPAATEQHTEAAPEADDVTVDRLYADFAAAQDKLLSFFKVPSWKRMLVALLCAGAVGYVIGYIGAFILDALLIGAIAMGTGIFLQTVIAIIGIALILYASWIAGGRIAGAVLTGEADERAQAAYNAVTETVSSAWDSVCGWFTSKSEPKAA